MDGGPNFHGEDIRRIFIFQGHTEDSERSLCIQDLGFNSVMTHLRERLWPLGGVRQVLKCTYLTSETLQLMSSNGGKHRKRGLPLLLVCNDLFTDASTKLMDGWMDGGSFVLHTTLAASPPLPPPERNFHHPSTHPSIS